MTNAIPPDDRGLLLGDGLFETILAQAGRLDHFEAHIVRMISGCAVIGLKPPGVEAARRAAMDALEAAGLIAGRAAVRLTLTAGSGRGPERPEGATPRLFASASAAMPAKGPVSLVTVAIRRNETSPTSRLKSLAYLDNVLARREARRLGADEALMLNSRGELACAAVANLFWISGDRLFTPALECGVLDGIMRGRVLRAAAALGVEALQVRAPLEVLQGAEGAFVTNSLIGLGRVLKIDDRAMPAHPMVGALSSRCR